MNPLVGVFEEKKKIIELLESLLNDKSVSRARRDHHAKRKPRPCGMTIHTGIGCSLGCLYCYVPDMGFEMKPRPYPLSPLELVYSLAVNPYLFPGYTLAAYGSVTEPFLPETMDKAIEYIRTVYKYLKLPSQVSTKIPLSSDTAKRLRKAEPGLSILLTVVTIEKARQLEPNAPSPIERLESVRELRKAGLHVTLFVRPIIPGITDKEIERIAAYAMEVGVNGAVLGSLRVTPGIIKRLASIGYPVSEINKRLPRKPRGNRDQVTIIEQDLKAKVKKVLESYGIKVYPSACAANIEAHRLSCNACKYGPCGKGELPTVKTKWFYSLLEYLGTRARNIVVTNEQVIIDGLREDKHPENIREILKHFIIAVTRRKPLIK